MLNLDPAVDKLALAAILKESCRFVNQPLLHYVNLRNDSSDVSTALPMRLHDV
jgi:hypothetical protein